MYKLISLPFQKLSFAFDTARVFSVCVRVFFWFYCCYETLKSKSLLEIMMIEKKTTISVRVDACFKNTVSHSYTEYIIWNLPKDLESIDSCFPSSEQRIVYYTYALTNFL